jgi:hypothetical protein
MKKTTEKVTQGLERAEAGDPGGAAPVRQAEKVDPASADAAEQVASDGPEGRGLAR